MKIVQSGVFLVKISRISVQVSQNELLTYLWYLNLRCTLKGLGMIQKFNNDDNDDEDQYKYQWWEDENW